MAQPEPALHKKQPSPVRLIKVIFNADKRPRFHQLAQSEKNLVEYAIRVPETPEENILTGFLHFKTALRIESLKWGEGFEISKDDKKDKAQFANIYKVPDYEYYKIVSKPLASAASPDLIIPNPPLQPQLNGPQPLHNGTLLSQNVFPGGLPISNPQAQIPSQFYPHSHLFHAPNPIEPLTKDFKNVPKECRGDFNSIAKHYIDEENFTLVNCLLDNRDRFTSFINGYLELQLLSKTPGSGSNCVGEKTEPSQTDEVEEEEEEEDKELDRAADPKKKVKVETTVAQGKTKKSSKKTEPKEKEPVKTNVKKPKKKR